MFLHNSTLTPATELSSRLPGNTLSSFVLTQVPTARFCVSSHGFAMQESQEGPTFSQMALEQEEFATESATATAASEEPPTAADEELPEPRVVSNKNATVEDLYADLEEVNFPEQRVKDLLGPDVSQTIEKFRGALQLPFPTIFFAMVSLTSFALHRTSCHYTSMLGIPPLPWICHLGRTGDGKSLVVWLIKQVVLEVQQRVNRRLFRAKKKEPAPAPPLVAAASATSSASAAPAGARSGRAIPGRRRLTRVHDTSDDDGPPAPPTAAAPVDPALEKIDEDFWAAFPAPVDPASDSRGSRRSCPQPPTFLGDEDLEEIDDAMAEPEKDEMPVPVACTADTGTIHGWGRLKGNKSRLHVALHEGKSLLSKVMENAPGCDPQSLNKLHDRDEFSNTVLTSASKFQELQPWVVVWLALHAEDMQDLFSGNKDPLAVFHRPDWFARDNDVADLEHYEDLDQDYAIGFLADLLEITEAQFPDLSHDQMAFFTEAYSQRTNLWRIDMQKTAFFKASFNTHAAAQRQAKKDRQPKEAAFRSKVKTKECRYAVPTDALAKAITQRLALEKYRKLKTEAAPTTKEARRWLMKNILELREELLRNDSEQAAALGIEEQWPLPVSDDHAEVGHIVTSFFGQSSALCAKWLQSGNCLSSLAAGKDGSVLKVLDPEELAKALRQETGFERIVKNCQVLLTNRYQVYKFALVRRQLSTGRDLDIAASLLVHLGLVAVFPWKKQGASGYASICFAKRPKSGNAQFDLEVCNSLRDVLRGRSRKLPRDGRRDLHRCCRQMGPAVGADSDGILGEVRRQRRSKSQG